MPWFFDRDFHISVVHLLTAGDVAARPVAVKDAFGIEVTVESGDKVIWSNSDAKVWAYTRVDTSGDQQVFRSELPWDALPEEVAKLIATHDYGQELVSPE